MVAGVETEAKGIVSDENKISRRVQPVAHFKTGLYSASAGILTRSPSLPVPSPPLPSPPLITPFRRAPLF